MITFGITMLIIWTISFILTLVANDNKTFKINFIITWFVLMLQLINK